MGIAEAGFCGDYCGKCPNYPDKCRGCVPPDHMDCYFAKCCLNKRIEHCGFCPDFSCKKLTDFCSAIDLNARPDIILRTCVFAKLLGRGLGWSLSGRNGIKDSVEKINRNPQASCTCTR